jgi:hypothetical protein
MEIDKLIVGKCYKLKSDDTYLGKLTAEPMIMGSGEGREMTAIFIHNGKTKYIPRWENFDMNKLNFFIQVDCVKLGGRGKTLRRRRKHYKKRSTRSLSK